MANKEQALIERQKRFVPIGVKLIGIISFIIVTALVGMTALATIFFSDEVRRSIQLSTFERAELVSQKVTTELRSFQDRGKLLAASVEGGLLFSGGDFSLTDLFFSQDEDIVAIGIITRDADGAFVTQASAMNTARLKLIGEAIGEPLDWLAGQEDAILTALRGGLRDTQCITILSLSYHGLIVSPRA